MSHEAVHPALPARDPKALSRRSVVRTAVWSIPAITLVSAAPAFATSALAAPDAYLEAYADYSVSASTDPGERTVVLDPQGVPLSHHFEFSAQFVNQSETADAGVTQIVISFGAQWLAGAFFEVREFSEMDFASQGWELAQQSTNSSGGVDLTFTTTELGARDESGFIAFALAVPATTAMAAYDAQAPLALTLVPATGFAVSPESATSFTFWGREGVDPFASLRG